MAIGRERGLCLISADNAEFLREVALVLGASIMFLRLEATAVAVGHMNRIVAATCAIFQEIGSARGRSLQRYRTDQQPEVQIALLAMMDRETEKTLLLGVKVDLRMDRGHRGENFLIGRRSTERQPPQKWIISGGQK